MRLAKLAPYALSLAAVLATYAGTYWTGKSHGKAQVQSAWDSDRAYQESKLAAIEQAHRQREAQLHEQAQRIEDELTRAQRGALEELDTTLANLRADNLRLRQRFTACRVPQDSDTPGGDDGAGTGGLSEQDAEFLVRLAGDADRVANKLAACQWFVASITE